MVNTPQSEASPWTSWMTCAVRIASRIEGLPAVATSDWGEQAAACLGALPGVFGVAVVLARTERIDTPIEIDAVGVSAGAPLAGQVPLSTQAALGVRSRLEQLGASGALTLDEPALGSPGLWDDADERPALQTWGRLGTGPRVVIVQVGLHRGESSDAVRLGAVLESLTPLLTRRARLALGDAPGAPVWLTSRERLVLEQLILGRSVRAIADQLDRSPHTVHDHVKNLHRKLGASSRGALIARALGRVAANGSGEAMETAARAKPLRASAGGASGQVEPKPSPVQTQSEL